MNTNLEMYKYIEDEFLTPIPVNNHLTQLDREILASELISTLKISDNHDDNPVKQHAEFLAALALRFLSRF